MIVIDGVLYQVPIISIQRKFEFLDKFAERSNDGKLNRELIDGYQNYSISFGTGADVEAYAALWEKITEPVEFHTVTVPDGDGAHTFEGYFANIADSMFKYRDPQAFYKGLTLNIVSRKPTRK